MSPRQTLLSVFRRWRRWGISAVFLVGLYTIFGFLILPLILKSMIPERVGRLLGRQVTLERIRTNPFTLSITIDGFQIKDPDGSALIAWNRLYVNAELWPLLKKQLGFKVIDLDRPQIRVVLLKGGHMNFADIVDRLNRDSGTGPAKSSVKSSPMELLIGHLKVTNAQLAFIDRSQTAPFATTLGPISINLDGFRTEHDTHSPYAFKGRTEAGEGFAWSGTVDIQPLKSSGVLEVSALQLPKYAPYYQKQLAFEIPQGRVTTHASYEFEWSEARHIVKIMDGSLSLDDVAFQEKNRKEPSIQLPSIRVAGVNADLLQSAVEIAHVSLKDGVIHARRDRDGHINLQSMFTPPEQPAKEKPSEVKLHIQDLSLENYGIQVEDQVPARPVLLQLDRIGGSLTDFSLDPGHASPLELALRIGEKASLQIKGSISPLRGSGDVTATLDGLDLPPLDSYFDSFSDVRLNHGKLGLNGRVRFAFEGKKDDGLTYIGEVQVSDFEARDSIQNEPFLRWKRLRLLGSDFNSKGPSITLKNVDWSGPEARLVMAKGGGSNVTRALRVAPAGPVASMVPQSPAEGPHPLVRIAKMAIKGGRLSFIDRSLEPNAALLLSDLEGVYTGLSTEAKDATLADFKGMAGGFAPITIHGKAMPLQHDKDTDVAIQIVGADLTDFSPYTGKYLGYTTREGKLHVDAHVRIQNRKLNIEDKVRLDRMYLGDKVDSPDATHLPVKLGLALLRDRKGVIELDIPVEGSLDDPDIHYGKMVWKAIFNVLGKIVTSPFTLLSNMFGGSGEDLSAISFAPGESTIGPAEQKKLDILVKALMERPELKLEIDGVTDASDALVFKKQELEKLLKTTKWAARKIKTVATPEEETIDPSEREALLRAAFEAAFPPPKGAKVEPPPLAELENRMLGTIAVDPNLLRQLSDARNKASIEGLLRGGQVEQSRLFVTQGSEAAKAGGAKVYFTLK